MSVKDLVAAIVAALVDFPDKVEIREVSGEENTLFEVRANKLDVGRVIGKQGRNVNAIRILLRAIGAKQRRHFNVEVLQ